MKKKLIVFDFDGVIEDTFELSFSFFNEQIPELTHDEYQSWFDDNFFAVIKEKGISFDIALLYQQYESALKEKNIKPSIKMALEELCVDSSLAIISSSYDDALNEYLSRNNVSKLFDYVWGVKKHVSKAEKFDLLLQEYDIEKTDCYFITDTVGDIKEAREAGIQSIGVSWGFHSRERLESANPLVVVETPEELKNFGLIDKNSC